MKKFKPTINRIKTMLSLGWEECCSPYFVGVPAQMAFYLFMSVLPMLILFSQLMGLFSLSITEIENWANLNISDEGVAMILDLISGTPSGAGNIFLACTAIWGASKAQYAFNTISNKILSDGEYAGRGFIKERLRSIITTLVMLLIFALALVILIYAPALLRVVFGYNKAMQLASSIWMSLRWLVVFALYFLAILFFYFSTRRQKPDLMFALPGSIFATVGFLFASLLFRLYVRMSASRDIIYGTMSNFVVLLMWFWMMSWIVILGVVVNKVWDQTRNIQRYVPDEDYLS